MKWLAAHVAASASLQSARQSQRRKIYKQRRLHNEDAFLLSMLNTSAKSGLYYAYPELSVRTSTAGDHTMFPFLLIMGSVIILLGIFNKQMLRILGFKPTSEVFTTPNLKHSSRIIEQIGQWLVITLGASFLVLGLGGALPNDISRKISFLLLGLSGLMLLAILGITIVNWKAK
jgi:hypothetical protein